MSYIYSKNMTKNYTVGNNHISALKEVSFMIEKSELTVILGPSGSGKTTLLNILGGMDGLTSGELFIENEAVHELNEQQLTLYRRNQIGFIFQFYNLIPTLTAYENVLLSERIGQKPFNALEILKRVKMDHRLTNFPQELSGGEQQRVSIARAICKNPRIILCDEPTGALDSETGKQVLKLLKEMTTIHGHTILLVTHNAAIAEIADHVLHLKDGKIIDEYKQTKPKEIDEVTW